MTTDVLTLNRNYMAIHVMDSHKALSLVYQDAAEAVDDTGRGYKFDDWVELSKIMADHPGGFINTVSLRIAIPEVIRLTKYDRLPKAEIKFTRQNIFEHYKWICSYCGKRFPSKQLNLDHVIPRSKGGKTNWNNIVLSCVPCNSRKDDKTPEEAAMRLLVAPSQPKWKGHKTLLSINLPMTVRKSWQAWLDKAYWNTELEHD